MNEIHAGFEILNNVLDKCGINEVVPSLFKRKMLLREFQIENEISLKKTVIENDSLTFEQKVILNSLITKNLKEFQRQLEILKIAADNMEADANADNIDWFLDYYYKIAKIGNNGENAILCSV